MNHNAQLAIVGIVCLLIGGGGGYFIRNSQVPARGQFGARAGGAGGAAGAAGRAGGGQFGAQGGQRPTIGTIQSISGSDMTLKTADGSSHVVLLSPTTTYNKIVAGQASDFPVGSNVIVTGQMQADGSLTANSVQAAPTMMNRGGNGGGAPAGQPNGSNTPSTSPAASQAPTGY